MKLPEIAVTGLVRLRDFLVPIALFSLVALGLHAGSDRLDDLAFRLLNGVDRFFDYVLSGAIKSVLGVFRVGPGTIARWSYAAISVIDIEEKRWAARVLALGVELLADVMLVWPVLRYRRDRTPWRQALPTPRTIRNVGAVFAPIAVALAGVAGAWWSLNRRSCSCSGSSDSWAAPARARPREPARCSFFCSLAGG